MSKKCPYCNFDKNGKPEKYFTKDFECKGGHDVDIFDEAYLEKHYEGKNGSPVLITLGGSDPDGWEQEEFWEEAYYCPWCGRKLN